LRKVCSQQTNKRRLQSSLAEVTSLAGLFIMLKGTGLASDVASSIHFSSIWPCERN